MSTTFQRISHYVIAKTETASSRTGYHEVFHYMNKPAAYNDTADSYLYTDNIDDACPILLLQTAMMTRDEIQRARFSWSSNSSIRFIIIPVYL